MSDLRTLKRGRGGPRIRSVQGRLFQKFDDDEATGSAVGTAVVPDRPAPAQAPPPAYRGVVAGWPEDWRERWGRRANELEDAGLGWRDAEAQAFVEVWNLVRRPPSGSEPDRNAIGPRPAAATLRRPTAASRSGGRNSP